jgi:hypothetical protein
LLDPTLEAVAATGLLIEIETLHLDRAYDYPKIRRQLHDWGLVELDIQQRAANLPDGQKPALRLGLRWRVESTNSWLSNYGQLRRSTDRRIAHRHAALCLVTVILITAKLIDWRDRWSPIR